MIKQNKTSRLHFILKFEMAAIWIKDFHGIRRVHFVLMGTAARRRLKMCTRQEYQSLDKYLTSCKVSKNVYQVNDCPLSWHIGPQLHVSPRSVCSLTYFRLKKMTFFRRALALKIFSAGGVSKRGALGPPLSRKFWGFQGSETKIRDFTQCEMAKSWGKSWKKLKKVEKS